SILAGYAPDGVLPSFQALAGDSTGFSNFSSKLGDYLDSVDPRIMSRINDENSNYSAVIDHLPK
ncbi:hypothetical protein, partial [Mycobacteroides abscessus]